MESDLLVRMAAKLSALKTGNYEGGSLAQRRPLLAWWQQQTAALSPGLWLVRA